VSVELPEEVSFVGRSVSHAIVAAGGSCERARPWKLGKASASSPTRHATVDFLIGIDVLRRAP
jgi:hypothetical protein